MGFSDSGNEGDFGGEDFGDENAGLGGDAGFGDEGGNDKPFDDKPFDAGVEADEETDPEKYIQQLSGKLGQSLRKHTEELGAPDYDLEKFAINSVITATNSGEMDAEDQSDIINKIKASTTDGTGKKDEEPAEAEPSGDEGDSDVSLSDAETEDGGLDLSKFGMEETVLPTKKNDDLLDKQVMVGHRKEIGIVKGYDDKFVHVEYPDLGFKETVNYKTQEVKFLPNQFNEDHNPNLYGKTVFSDAVLGVNDGGMEENKYLNLESTKKNSNIADKKNIKNMLLEKLSELEPLVKPLVKPKVVPIKRNPYKITPTPTVVPSKAIKK